MQQKCNGKSNYRGCPFASTASTEITTSIHLKTVPSNCIQTEQQVLAMKRWWGKTNCNLGQESWMKSLFPFLPSTLQLRGKKKESEYPLHNCWKSILQRLKKWGEAEVVYSLTKGYNYSEKRRGGKKKEKPARAQSTIKGLLLFIISHAASPAYLSSAFL